MAQTLRKKLLHIQENTFKVLEILPISMGLKLEKNVTSLLFATEQENV